jgi:hypothetical protein
MGMFDNIKCEYKLPIDGLQDEIFQTKDFECLLDTYTITKDGKLILHEIEMIPVPEEERPYYGKPEWNDKNGLYKFFGSLKSIPIGDKFIDHTGKIRFYTSLKKGWVEFEAKFFDGILQDIQIVEYHEKGF